MKDMLLSQYRPKSELVTRQTRIDKPRFPVIDFHMHYGLSWPSHTDEAVLNEAQVLDQNGVYGVVNLDGYEGDKTDQQLAYLQPLGERVVTFGWVDLTKVADDDFASYAADTIRAGYEKGIRGLKFFKDVSLVQKDRHGSKIRIDDERLGVVWETAAKLDIPVLIHIADPPAFFKPVDEHNERFEQLIKHPNWSFYGDEFFSFEELMQMQENLLTQNPKTVFVVAHVGSYPENLAHVSEQMDRHANMYVDIAARASDLGRQPYSARKFMLRHHRRILFGTDGTFGAKNNHPVYYRFLETDDEYFDYGPVDYKGRWKMYGIDLPDDVLRHIYYKNALALVPDFAKCLEKA